MFVFEGTTKSNIDNWVLKQIVLPVAKIMPGEADMTRESWTVFMGFIQRYC